jgi:hypothetical protein
MDDNAECVTKEGIEAFSQYLQQYTPVELCNIFQGAHSEKSRAQALLLSSEGDEDDIGMTRTKDAIWGLACQHVLFRIGNETRALLQTSGGMRRRLAVHMQMIAGDGSQFLESVHGPVGSVVASISAGSNFPEIPELLERLSLQDLYVFLSLAHRRSLALEADIHRPDLQEEASLRRMRTESTHWNLAIGVATGMLQRRIQEFGNTL